MELVIVREEFIIIFIIPSVECPCYMVVHIVSN
jgi:hypothetical protein